MITIFFKEPIIIERLDEKNLTKKEKELMEATLEDLRKRRIDKFLTLNELKKSIESENKLHVKDKVQSKLFH